VKANQMMVHDKETFEACQQTVKSFLNRSAFRFVDLKSLLNFGVVPS